MEGIKLEAGKYYRLRGGKKAFVAAFNPFDSINSDMVWVGFIEGETECVGGWGADGRWYANRENPYDIIAEWVEPKRIKGWVNVYPPRRALGCIFDTKEDADTQVGAHDRIACIKIDVLEGEGLEKAS